MIEEENLIEITDEDGKTYKFELYDIIEFEEKEYGVLLEINENGEEGDLVLMRYLEEGEDSFFETIDDEAEFEKVKDYYDSLPVEDEE